MRAQQGTDATKQEDPREHKGERERDREGSYWRLRFYLEDPPLRDDGRGHNDKNDRTKQRLASNTVANRPWQGRQLFQVVFDSTLDG